MNFTLKINENPNLKGIETIKKGEEETAFRIGDETVEKGFIFTSSTHAVGPSSSCRGVNGYIGKKNIQTDSL